MSQDVLIRSFKPDTDSGFIFSTFPKNAYYSNYNEITKDRDQWFKDFYSYLKAELEESSTYIATLDDNYTILGYAIINPLKILQFIYVKELFRKQGIATLLLKNKKLAGINENNLTRIGKAILSTHEHQFKENLNEPDPTKTH